METGYVLRRHGSFCKWCGKPILSQNIRLRLDRGASYDVYTFCSSWCYKRARTAGMKTETTVIDDHIKIFSWGYAEEDYSFRSVDAVVDGLTVARLIMVNGDLSFEVLAPGRNLSKSELGELRIRMEAELSKQP